MILFITGFVVGMVSLMLVRIILYNINKMQVNKGNELIKVGNDLSIEKMRIINELNSITTQLNA